MAQTSGTLITHNYTNFRGIDLSGGEVALYRSPSALNMWRNYKSLGKCLETRPSTNLVTSFTDRVLGFFFYKVGATEQLIVHSGTKLYKVVGDTKTEITPSGITMNFNINLETKFLVYNSILYILDGTHYLQYDGTTCKEVEPYIPTSTIAMTPLGSGTPYEGVNLLTPLRINTFVGDGVSTNYYVDAHKEGIDSTYVPRVWVYNYNTLVWDELSPSTDFSVDYEEGKITFDTAPNTPDSVGTPNVKVQFSKTTGGYADRIKNCTLMTEFDNRIFFSGNPNYPTTLFYGWVYQPNFIPDNFWVRDGNDDSKIKGLVTGNNALWVFKEPSQSGSVFYHVPTTYLDDLGNTLIAYTSTNSSIELGCKGKAVNFNDDIVFISDRGLEGITQDVTKEQFVSHRSYYVDSMLNAFEDGKTRLAEWQGYLLIAHDKDILLADSNQDYSSSARYDWFLWTMEKNITAMLTHNDTLYMSCISTNNYPIYALTNNSPSRTIESYWTTPYDEFGYPQYLKTTNKRGFVIDGQGEVNVSSTINNTTETELASNLDMGTKEYTSVRIKQKKWKGIQIKIYSTKPFKLYSFTLESYVGGYIKR